MILHFYISPTLKPISNGIDSGPSFQLGHDVSQILMNDDDDGGSDDGGSDFDEDEDDPNNTSSVVHGVGTTKEQEEQEEQEEQRHEEEDDDDEPEEEEEENTSTNLSVDISGRVRNPKRNLSEVKLTDLSVSMNLTRGSCSSPAPLKQRLQRLRRQSDKSSDSMDSSFLSDG